MKDDLNLKKNKIYRKRAIKSILLLLLTILLFVTATYAWFTDSAFSKGNKVFAGNMYIDIIASDEEIIQNGLASPENIDIIYPNKYTRKLTTDDNDDGTTYRIITDENANIVSIYNFEPGQFKKAHVNFMNSGDLAFKTVGALKIESNLNGIETLNEQYKKNLEVYKNKYQITDEARVGNAQTVDAIKSVKDTIFDKGEENVLKDSNNIVKVGNVDCEVVSFVKYNETKDEYELCEANSNPTHALMTTKDFVKCDYYVKSICYADTSYQQLDNLSFYEDQYINQAYTSSYSDSNLFNSDPGIVEINAPYYSLIGAYEFDSIIDNFDNLEKSETENKVHLFSLDVKLAKDHLNSFLVKNSTVDFPFWLNAGVYKINNSGGASFAALGISYTGEDEGVSNCIKIFQADRPNACCRPFFYYSLDAIKKQDTTIDPFKIFEANNDDNPSNNYDDGIFAEGEFTYDDYLYRFNKLINMIPYISENEYNALEEDEKSLYKPLIKLNEDSSEATPIIGYTKHGNLSNVLEVYASSDFEEVRKHHESDAYFGTLDQFEYLISNGPTAIKDLSSVSAILNNNTPEDNYKVICNDPSANLYDDYQRYLSYASGYCVPKETITNSVGKIDPNTKVKVYAGSVNDPTSTYELIQVSEIGSIDFFLYMPEEVNSTYQNASLSLSIGGTATQVPFEVDDLGFMIYDEMIYEKSDPIVNTDVETGDVISLKFVNKDNEPVDSFFRVVSTDNNNATLMLLSQRDIRTAYLKQEDSDLPIENVKGIDIMSIDKSGIPDYLNSLYESIDNLDYKDSIVKQKYKQDVYELKALHISNYNFYGTPGGPYEVGDFNDCDYIITLRNLSYGGQTIELIKYGVKYAFSNDKEIEGYFRLPSIKDLASCAGLSGSKVIDVEDIIKIIYGSAEIPSNVEFYPSWTSDAIYKSDALKEENVIKISFVLSYFLRGVPDISTLATVTSTGVDFIGLPSTVLNNDEIKAEMLNELKATRLNINPVFIIPLSELSEIKPVFKKDDPFSEVFDELIDYKNIDFYYISYGGEYDQPYVTAISSNSSDIKETLYDNEININFYGHFYRTENIADQLQQLFDNFNEHLDTSVPQIFTIEIPYKNVSNQEAFFNFLSNSEIIKENSQFYIYLLGDCYVDLSKYYLPNNVNTSLLVTPNKFVELLKSNGLSSEDVAMKFGDQSLSKADDSVYTNVVGEPKIVDFNKNGIAKTGESLNNNAKFLVASSVYLDAISLFNDYFRDNPTVSHVANLNVFIFDAGDDYAAIDDALNALSIKYSNHINYSIYGVDMDNVLKNLTNNIISTLNDVDKISLPIIKKLK